MVGNMMKPCLLIPSPGKCGKSFSGSSKDVNASSTLLFDGYLSRVPGKTDGI
jgi:hypothetical protein